MIAAALSLLGVTALAGLVLTTVGERLRPQWGAVLLPVLLAVTAVLAWRAHAASTGLVQLAAVLATAVAVLAGGPVASAVLRSADPTSAAETGGPSDPEVLRGGAWVGVLERAALVGTLLAGWPEGLAVVIAVKGLGRYAELKAPAAAERFIIGTLASLLWAAACVGCVVLLRR